MTPSTEARQWLRNLPETAWQIAPVDGAPPQLVEALLWEIDRLSAEINADTALLDHRMACRFLRERDEARRKLAALEAGEPEVLVKPPPDFFVDHGGISRVQEVLRELMEETA